MKGKFKQKDPIEDILNAIERVEEEYNIDIDFNFKIIEIKSKK